MCITAHSYYYSYLLLPASPASPFSLLFSVARCSEGVPLYSSMFSSSFRPVPRSLSLIVPILRSRVRHCSQSAYLHHRVCLISLYLSITQSRLFDYECITAFLPITLPTYNPWLSLSFLVTVLPSYSPSFLSSFLPIVLLSLACSTTSASLPRVEGISLAWWRSASMRVWRAWLMDYRGWGSSCSLRVPLTLLTLYCCGHNSSIFSFILGGNFWKRKNNLAYSCDLNNNDPVMTL